MRLLAVTCFRLLGLTSAPLSLGDVPFCSTLYYVVELVGGCFLVRLLYFGSPFNSRCKDNDYNHNLYRFNKLFMVF